MQIRDSVVVVTGAGSGIGAALAWRFAEEGAAAVVVSDRDSAAAEAVAAEIDAVADATDVTSEQAVAALVARTEERFGRIDLFCSNAGIGTGAGIEGSDDVWRQAFDVHVMAHVYAARAVLPGMLGRGHGYLLNTASAAGLLTSPGDAPYTVTKHGAVALAEWLAVHYRDRGIGVSVLAGLAGEPFLILPHPQVGTFWAQKASDPDRWLAGVRRLLTR